MKILIVLSIFLPGLIALGIGIHKAPVYENVDDFNRI